MKLITPLLGYALKSLCYPLEYVASQSIFSLPTPDIKIIRDQAYGAHPLQRLDIIAKLQHERIALFLFLFTAAAGFPAIRPCIIHSANVSRLKII